MPNVLVRDVEALVLEKLKNSAAKNGRSLQREMQIILREAATRAEPLAKLETARKIRNSLTVKDQTDSAKLLREDRRR